MALQNSEFLKYTCLQFFFKSENSYPVEQSDWNFKFEGKGKGIGLKGTSFGLSLKAH